MTPHILQKDSVPKSVSKIAKYQKNVTLSKKQELRKALIFTLLLHLILLGSGIFYWQYHKISHLPAIDTPAIEDTTEQPAIVPMKLEADILDTESNSADDKALPTPIVKASKEIAKEGQKTAKDMQQKASKVPNLHTKAIQVGSQTTSNTLKPNELNNSLLPPKNKLEQINTPTVNSHTIIINKVESAPINKILTKRDISKNESNALTYGKASSVEQRTERLTNDIEMNNDKLSKLIEQVKDSNQQKIDKNSTHSLL